MDELFSEGQVIFPGDVVGQLKTDSQTQVRLGAGLRQDHDNVIATKAGEVHTKHHLRYWVETNQKRYVPAVEDAVIGIIVERHADGYKVDIGAAQLAILPALAFEGATKRNRPTLEISSLVYARVVVANKDMDPELMCMSASSKADGFGELKGGFKFDCSLGLARSLLQPKSAVLQALGKALAYEIAVGVNGRVWINSRTPESIILIVNAITRSEFLPTDKIKELVQGMIKHMS